MSDDLAWLTDEQHNQIARGVCCDCNGNQKLRLGPRGGLSRNVACPSCGAEFNLGPVPGTSHRTVGSPRGQPNRARLREVYGIELPEQTDA